MNKILTHSVSTVLFSSIVAITGCSSDDASGPTGPAVPANAVTIEATNAYTLVQRASMAAFAIDNATEANTDPVATSNCYPSGTHTSTVNTTGDLLFSGSEASSGVVTLLDCGTYANGIADYYFVDGALTYSENETLNLTTGDVTFTASTSGSGIGLTITAMDTPTDTVTVNGYNVSSNGSYPWGFGSGSYSATVQFSYDSLTLLQGFAAQSSTAITGPTGSACPTGGVLLVTGAAGSQARGTFRNDSQVLIEYKPSGGAWTEDTLYACADFEA